MEVKELMDQEYPCNMEARGSGWSQVAMEYPDYSEEESDKPVCFGKRKGQETNEVYKRQKD